MNFSSMNMDISILLALQEFRNGTGAFLAGFFSKMTWLGEVNTAIVIMALIYWCVSKDFGTYFLMGWSGNRLVNGVLKVTACAYRPWIRDARVVPYGDSITTATGYSFPSGHTMNAATVFGGGAVRKDIPRALRIMLGLLVLLVAFSRNYLGVHTPQDVLAGAAAGTLVMYLSLDIQTLREYMPCTNRRCETVVSRNFPARGQHTSGRGDSFFFPLDFLSLKGYNRLDTTNCSGFAAIWQPIRRSTRKK